MTSYDAIDDSAASEVRERILNCYA
jgi:hypothetical protein